MSETLIEKQDDIIELPFPDNLRTRPGMYIGSTDTPNVLLREVIDNCIDECYKCKTCNTVVIENIKDHALVIDNGRGISIKSMSNNPDMTMARSACFTLHSGGKFNKSIAEIGQNGVGGKACVALSKMHVLIVRATDDMIKYSTPKVKLLRNQFDHNDDIYYCLISSYGILQEEKLIRKSDINKIILFSNVDFTKYDIGTLIYFEPDPTIFSSTKMQIPDTLSYFKYITDKVYNKSINLYVNNEEYNGFFKPYPIELVTDIQSNYPDEVKNPSAKYLISCTFNEDFNESSTTGSINGLIVNQGVHINLAKEAYRRAYDYMFSGFDYRSLEDKGMSFSIITLCPEPVFSSQTKERCSQIPGIDRYCIQNLVNAFEKIIKRFYKEFSLHNQKLKEFINMTRDLSRMEYIAEKIPVVALDGSRKADKLVPVNVKTCSTKNRDKAELFIVEGKSAAGSVIKARDPEYQAVMPLRGKPLNSANLDILDILQNEEMHDLIATIGTGVDERFSLDKVQYGKIIITADADPDGANIASLVLGMFFGHMKYLIKAGMVYICDSPLYKQGDKYYYNDNCEDIDFSKPTTRFKGLGELNLADVKATITNSDTRRLVRVTEENMRLALRLITDTYARKMLLMKSGIINESKLLKYLEVK